MLKNKQSRLRAIEIICKKWLESYNLESNQNSKKIAEKIVETYEIVVRDFREVLNEDHNADIYKVISGTQLSIIYCQPIHHPNPKIAEKLNVVLAFFTAFSFLNRYKKVDFTGFHFDGSATITELLKKHNEFLLRMHEKQPIEMPVISNALFWEATVELFYKTHFQTNN